MTAPRSPLAHAYADHGEKVRFLVGGFGNTLLGYGLFLLLIATVGEALSTWAGSPNTVAAFVGEHYYLVVQWLDWVLMVPVSTTTMKFFAFRSKGRWLHQIGRAYLVYLPAQGLSSLILWLTVSIAGLSPQVGQAITIAVTTVFSYLGHKYFTFRVPLEVGEVPAEELLD